jgi:hypothetical protein
MVSFCTLCARPARGGSLSGPFSTLLDPPPQQQAHRRTRSPWATPASPAARHALPAVGTLLPRLLLAYSLTALPALLFLHSPTAPRTLLLGTVTSHDLVHGQPHSLTKSPPGAH